MEVLAFSVKEEDRKELPGVMERLLRVYKKKGQKAVLC